jgi:hypothetical protein
MKVGDLVTLASDPDATFQPPGLVVARHGRALDDRESGWLKVLWPSRTSIHHENLLKRVCSDGNDSAHNKKLEKLWAERQTFRDRKPVR